MSLLNTKSKEDHAAFYIYIYTYRERQKCMQILRYEQTEIDRLIDCCFDPIDSRLEYRVISSPY